MQILAVGAMAVGPTTGALALDERAREHVAEGTEAANEPAAGSEIGFVRHFLSDSNNSVRIRASQALFEICKNVPNRRRWGRRCKLTADGACRRGVYGITGSSAALRTHGLQTFSSRPFSLKWRWPSSVVRSQPESRSRQR